MSPELFANMHCWNSLQGSGCEADPHSLPVTPGRGQIELSASPFVSLTHIVGDPLIGSPLLLLCMWRYGSESGHLIVQF